MTSGFPARTDLALDAFARDVGEVFASFLEQDSGCREYGVELGGERWFLKAAVEPRAVASVEGAIRFHTHVRHDAIIPLRRVVGGPSGPVLVYPWVDGEVLYGPGAPDGRTRRLDPRSTHARFRRLSVAEILAAIESIFDAHLAVTDAGFVAVDLYDGSLVYDFSARKMWLCDLDDYQPGPFTLEADRLPGSTRFMAPEEFQRGATIDQRTTVFDLARTALVLLDEADVDTRFRGTPALAAVARRATDENPRDRYATVAEFVAAWRRAAGTAA